MIFLVAFFCILTPRFVGLTEQEQGIVPWEGRWVSERILPARRPGEFLTECLWVWPAGPCAPTFVRG